MRPNCRQAQRELLDQLAALPQPHTDGGQVVTNTLYRLRHPFMQSQIYR